MNGKVSIFLDKIKRTGKSKNGRTQSIDENASASPNGIVERELETISKPIDLESFASPVDIGDGVDDGVSSGKGCQLAYTLDQLLTDSSALSYFIHFLESCEKLNLIKFWMHVEGFRSSVDSAKGEGTRDAAQQMCFLDARNIYHKYIDEQSPSTVALPKKILTRMQAKIDPDHFSTACFDEAQMFLRELFELRYFPEFLSSVYYKKHELEVLSRPKVTLLDVLHVETLLTAFLETTSEHGDSHLVQMVLAVDTWEKQWRDCGDEEVLDDAMAIYDRFFSMQASRCRIPISDEARRSLEASICSESGRPQRRAFYSARQWAIGHLTKRYLSPFVHSSAFSSYLSSLVHTVETTVELPRAGKRRPRDENSSGADSLPVVFNRHFESLERRLSMGSEGRTEGAGTPQDTPPTPRTPRTARLAEVDSMGRYTPLYDTTFTAETQNAQSKLKMRFRKYWDKSALREEELAEEVARTIIADIQTMVDAAGTG